MQAKEGGDCEKWGWLLISDGGLMKQLGMFAQKDGGDDDAAGGSMCSCVYIWGPNTIPL